MIGTDWSVNVRELAGSNEKPMTGLTNNAYLSAEPPSSSDETAVFGLCRSTDTQLIGSVETVGDWATWYR